MKFLSVRNGASGPQKKGWALPDEPKLLAKKKLNLQLGCKPASGWARPKYYIPPSPTACQVYRII